MNGAVVSAHMNHVISEHSRRAVDRLVDDYFAVSRLRDRRLFTEFLLEGNAHATLSSVEPRHFESALLAKLQLHMTIVLYDDLADHPRHADPELLAALYLLNIDVEPPRVYFADDNRRRTYDLAISLLQGIISLLRSFPLGQELAPMLAFDIHQFYQANRYAALISRAPHLASMEELRALGAHNMGLIASWTIDLMASPGIDRSQVGRCREIFALGQRVGRISNTLATHERELAEGDWTNELIVGSKNIALDDHRRLLSEEAERLLSEIAANERGVTAFDVGSYVDSLRRVQALHRDMQDII